MSFLKKTFGIFIFGIRIVFINGGYTICESFNYLYYSSMIKILKDDSETLSNLGVFDGYFIDFYNDNLTDKTSQFTIKKYNKYKEIMNDIDKKRDEKMSESQRLTYDIFSTYIKNELDGEKFMFYQYPLNHLDGAHLTILNTFTKVHRIKNENDVKNYISRLKEIDTKINQLLDDLNYRESIGIIPPLFSLEKCEKQISDFLSENPKENVLVVSLDKKISDIKTITNKEKYIDEATDITEKSVYPAYEKLLEYTRKLERNSNNIAGVWKLPNGDKYYEYKVKYYTNSEKTPQEIFDIGEKQVDILENKMLEIVKRIGFSDLKSFNDELNSKYKYENIEELSKDAKKLTEEVREDSVNSFEKFPKGELLWKTVSQMEYSSAPAAIYHHVNKSGSKPGVVIFNPILINRKNIFTYAAHEGIIGHHMGEGIKVQSQSLPFIRTILPFTTWSEGWAMYAEELALENYEKKTAYDEFAILQREMWAAVRMVVDVGIHYKRWTREQAIDYMKEKTGLSDKMVETEIERDCVDPGQALAYELSKLKFIEMRKYAENNLKNSFNEKDYHTFILENGAMPLDIFEKSIKNWVAQKKVNTNFILIFSPTDLLGTRLVIVYRSGFYI